MPDVFGSIQDAMDKTTEQAADLASVVKAQAIDGLDHVRSVVEAKPLTALGVALAVGFYLAVSMSRPQVKILYVREQPRRP